MDWVRLYHDMPTDPKWRVIARKSAQRISDVIAVFNFVLVNASANGADRGRLNNLSSEDVGAALDLEDSDVKAILEAMEGRVIAGNRLMAWEVRNPKREDDAAERTRDWRRRKRPQGDDGVTQRDAPVTQGDAPEKETEEEKEKEAAAARAREDDSSQINRINRVLGFSESDFPGFLSNLRTLVDLKAEGCDFERHILPAAEQAARGKKARSLAYIMPRARELRDAQTKVAALPPPFENTDERGWRGRLDLYRQKSMWGPTWGPKPDQPACKCPPAILAEWKAAA